MTNSLLDAVPCSYSACYSNTIAKMAKIGINSDNILLSYDGTYWKQKSNFSLYVKNHTIDGNTYTTVQNFALKPSWSEGWASRPMLWYDSGHSIQSKLNAYNYCVSLERKMITLSESTAGGANGVPYYYTWNWFDNGIFTGYGTHLYMNSSTGAVYATDAKYFRCAK